MSVANIFGSNVIDFRAYAVEQPGSENVKPAGDYIAELKAQLGKVKPRPGCELPWLGFGKDFRFRPGEVTLWAGVNGHGKSLMTGFVSLDLLCLGQRVCIASMEMKPHDTINRMLRQYTATDPDDDFVQQQPGAATQLAKLYDDFGTVASKLWIYDQVGSADTKTMQGVARYCAKELKINHLVIDNLMKCVNGEDDYNMQKDFVGELFSIARDYGIHVHVVHHIRKLDNEARIPDKMDIKGAGAITDIVDNVCVVWRNKSDISKRKPEEHDAVLNICKQRNGGGWEGKIGLYYEPESQQFTRRRSELVDWQSRMGW
jgi:twinkle protein